MAKQTRMEVRLSAQTWSGGQMVEDLNRAIDDALADIVESRDEMPTRDGDRLITLTLKVRPESNGRTLKTVHKVDLKVPRPEMLDVAWLDGAEAKVDLRLDPGTHQLDIERVLRGRNEGGE